MKLRGLRQIRQKRGMSISQLATASDLKRESISKLEQGHEDVEPSLVRRLARALGVSQGELMLGVLTPQPVIS